MKAIVVDEFYRLKWESVPEPELKKDEVLVRVIAAGVNRADLLQRRGKYPVPKGASKTLGLEVSGIVDKIGSSVTLWKPGDRITTLLDGGGYAEKVAVPEGFLLPVPDDMNLTEAAALPEVFLTAYLNIYLEGEAQPGEVVLVHAAASGVGTAALQLCQALDNPVFATASGPKLSALAQYNPTRAIDRLNESFLEVIQQSQFGGVDVILDLVGGSYLEDNLSALNHRGRLVVVGLLGGIEGNVRLDKLLFKRNRIIGSVLRGRSKEEKIAIIGTFRETVWPLYEKGKIVPVVDSILPIENADVAHEKLRKNDTIGKILLKVSES